MENTAYFYMGQNIEEMSREDLIAALRVIGKSEQEFRLRCYESERRLLDCQLRTVAHNLHTT